MEPIRTKTEEELRTVYRLGEDQMVALVMNLLQEYQSFEEHVQKLEGQIAKNSGNSSKPPSSDGLKKKPKSLRHKSGKKAVGSRDILEAR